MTLADAVARLAEAERSDRKARDLDEPEREVAEAARDHFAAQRTDLLRRADATLRIYFREALADDFDGVWRTMLDTVSGAFAGVLQGTYERVMRRGFESGAVDLGIDLAFDLNHPEAIEYLRNRGAERVAMIDAHSRDVLRNLITDGRDEGLSWAQTSRRISDQFGDFSRQRADLIAITETSDAYEQGRLATARSLEADGTPIEKRWIALGGNPCPICSGNVSAGWIPRAETFPSGHDVPTSHPRCFPAGVLVSGPRATASTARWYDGELVEIATRDGRFLPVTPNHPILTGEGWVAAGLLREGNQVVCGALSERVPDAVYPDHRERPALIEDVARSLPDTGSVVAVAVPTTAVDFHGDGIEGQVTVVRADGSLLGHRQAALAQPVCQHVLGRRSMGEVSLLRTSDLDALRERNRAPARRGVGGAGDLATLSQRRPNVSETALLGSAASGDASLAEAVIDGVAIDSEGLSERLHRLPARVSVLQLIEIDVHPLGPDGELLAPLGLSALVQSLVDRRQSDAKLARDLINGLSGPVTLDEIVNVRRTEFAGHVYNLQTEPGHYTANGIVVHNCRCDIAIRQAER